MSIQGKQSPKKEVLYVASENLMNEILKYLGKQPYIEVAPLVEGIRNIMPFHEAVEQIQQQNKSEQKAEEEKVIDNMEVVDAKKITGNKKQSK